MNILRKTLVGASATLLPVLLFCIGLSWSLFQVFGTPSPLKHSLNESGIYTVFVSNALKDANIEPAQKTDALITDTEVTKIVEDAFPPSYLEGETNGIIDGFYNWMQGKSTALSFSFNFSEPAKKTVAGVDAYMSQRLSTLAPCATLADAETQAGRTAGTITCIPPNFDKTAALQEAHDKLSKQLLETTDYNASNIKGKDGKSLQESLAYVPETYNQVRTIFVVAVIVALLLGATIVFAAATKRSGIKTLSIIVLISGFISSAAALTISGVTGKFVDTAINQAKSDDQIQIYTAKVIHILAADVKVWWLGLGITLLVLSTAALITLLIRRKRQEHHADIHAPAGFSSPLEHAQGSELNSAPKTAKQSKLPRLKE